MTIPVNTSEGFDSTPEVQRVEARMAAEGEALVEQTFTDYFAEPETHYYKLPDGKQYFAYTELREGGKALYEKVVNREGLKVQRATGEARIPIDPAVQRQTLIRVSVISAEIMYKDHAGNWEKLRFNEVKPQDNGPFWEKVFEKFPAKIIDDFHKQLEKVNPWLAADDDVDALKKQKEELEERIRRAEDEQAKKLSS